jgi:zinc transport system substrate-binding protein
VIASVYPVYEFTRRVAADTAEVASLVPTGVEPHDWEPSPEDVARVANSRVFVKNGAGLEPWADKLLVNVAGKGPAVVDATAGIALLGTDPHVWLDPVLAQAQVETIRIGLTAAIPAGAAAHAAAAAALTAELAALHARFEQGLADCAQRAMVVTHAAFGYLARRYGLKQMSIMGLGPEAEPSPAELARLVQLARQHAVTHVFSERLVAPKLAETLAREVGAATLVLNPVEGLTREEAAAGRGYAALMEDNLRNLRTGLRCR